MITAPQEERALYARQAALICRGDDGISKAVAAPLAVFPATGTRVVIGVYLPRADSAQPTLSVFNGRSVVTLPNQALTRTLYYPETIGGWS